MIRRLPYRDLHEAIYTRLTNDAATSSYTVYPASGVPLDAAFPYLTVQMLTALQDDSKNTVLNDTRAVVKAHTRDQVGKGDDGALYDIMNNVSKAITRTNISTGNGHSVIHAKPEAGNPISYVNEGFVHRDGEVELRLLIQDKGD